SAQFLGALTNSEPPPEPPSPAAPRHDPSHETHRTGTFSLPGHQNTPTHRRPRAGHSTLQRPSTTVPRGPVPPPRCGAPSPSPHGYRAGIAKIGPDGRLVAVASTGAVCLWDSHTGTHLGEFTGFHEQVHDLAFNAEGTLVATAHQDSTVRVWDLAGMRSLGVLSRHHGAVHAVTFAPGGRILASGGQDGTVHLWDLTTGVPATTLTGHTGTVHTIAFSHDGTGLATVGLDRNVCLWRSTGGPAQPLPLRLPEH